MAREVNKLSARSVKALSEPGRHADGGGLYLVIDQRGAKRWVFLYRMNGGRREMGLGSLLAVPLIKAREIAADARAKVAGGVDPIESRSTPPMEVAPAPVITFGDVADQYMADREKTWRNPIHRKQWRQTLQVQAAEIWSAPVAEIDTDAILYVLRPMWDEKPETARRIRGRIERVLDAARVGGHRSGENPARWRGHLDVLLPRPGKLKRGHHAALPYKDVPGFFVELRARPAPSARAMELLILTAARSGEVRGMSWSEINFDESLWTIPKARMKGNREHRVPLTPYALDLLRTLKPVDAAPDSLIFPTRTGTKQSDMVFTALLKRMKHGNVTAHGFRSSFRDWAADETDHPREIIEASLAHLVGDDTERAYRRGDALAKRRHLMTDWAAFVASAIGVDAK